MVNRPVALGRPEKGFLPGCACSTYRKRSKRRRRSHHLAAAAHRWCPRPRMWSTRSATRSGRSSPALASHCWHNLKLVQLAPSPSGRRAAVWNHAPTMQSTCTRPRLCQQCDHCPGTRGTRAAASSTTVGEMPTSCAHTPLCECRSCAGGIVP